MGRVLLLAFGAIYRQNWAWRGQISNKCMKTSHDGGSFRGIWGEKPAKKPPSDEGGGICEANDGGRDWAEGASPRPTWCVISWRLTTSAGAEVGAPGRRALRKKASPFQGEAVERSETDEGAHGGDAPLIRPLIRPFGPPSPLWGEGLRCVQEAAPSSSQASYPSLPPGGESSFISLLLLSPRDPLRWARAGAPYILSSDGPSSPVGAHIVRPRAATWGRPYES